MDYDMIDLFIIPTLVDEYTSAVEGRWGNCTATGVYLLSHWSKVSLRVATQFQSDFYANCIGNEDIVSCERTKDPFINSSDPALIKLVDEKYEALDGINQGGIT